VFAGAPSVTIADTATSGSDTAALGVFVTATDELSLRSTPSGTPTDVDPAIGWVEVAGPGDQKVFELVDAVDDVITRQPTPAELSARVAILRDRQLARLRADGPARVPRLGETGPPDFIGHAAVYADVIAFVGDEGRLFGCDEFDTWSILPGCFDASLAAGRDIVLLNLHDLGTVFASTAAGTLQLEADAYGLRIGVIWPQLVALLEEHGAIMMPLGWSVLATHHIARIVDRHAIVDRCDPIVEVSCVLRGHRPRGALTWIARATPESWARLGRPPRLM
jgi:hypothetical protein